MCGNKKFRWARQGLKSTIFTKTRRFFNLPHKDWRSAPYHWNFQTSKFVAVVRKSERCVVSRSTQELQEDCMQVTTYSSSPCSCSTAQPILCASVCEREWESVVCVCVWVRVSACERLLKCRKHTSSSSLRQQPKGFCLRFDETPTITFSWLNWTNRQQILQVFFQCSKF